MPTKKTFSNKDIANIFGEIATLSEFLNEDKFHILAYQKASRIALLANDSIQQVYLSGGIKALVAMDGIGETLAEHLADLFEHGTMTYHQSLLKKVPPIKLQMTKISGIGAKTASKLYSALKPKTLTDLSAKLKTAKAADNFGEKTIKNILDGIDAAKKFSGRTLLVDALKISNEVLEFLRSLPEVSQADAAGSIRRGREDVGDIDLVVATTSPKKTGQDFAGASFVKKVVRQGEFLVSIIHNIGIEIDLELSPKERYGNLLQHFTGSKDHAVKLRTLALQNKMSISEYGIKKGKQTLKHVREQDIYAEMGMQYIPPEMREDKGEIEAALNNNLPKLIELKDIKGNLHMHTSESDGKLSLADTISAAYDYGYKYIVITDHSKALGFLGGLDEGRLLKHHKNIKDLDKEYSKKGMRVFSGVELNILSDGQVDIEDRVLEQLDFVIASIHFSYKQSMKEVTARLIRAIENPHIDCIGHPSGRKLGKREGVNAKWREVFEAAAKHNTLLELNASPERLDLWGEQVRLAKELGCNFAINTDAHQVSHFDFMGFGVTQARRGWLTKGDVVNTKTAAEFAKWLGKRGKV